MPLSWYGLLAYAQARDDQAVKVINSYIELVEKYEQTNGVYPSELSVLSSDFTNVVWGFLPGNQLSYKLIDESYIIYYVQFPLGPGHVYSGRTQRWDYEEI